MMRSRGGKRARGVRPKKRQGSVELRKEDGSSWSRRCKLQDQGPASTGGELGVLVSGMVFRVRIGREGRSRFRYGWKFKLLEVCPGRKLVAETRFLTIVTRESLSV